MAGCPRSIQPLIIVLVAMLCSGIASHGQEAPNAEVLTRENILEECKPAAAWTPADVGQKLAIRDQVRTGEFSRSSIRLTNLAVMQMDELTTLEILPPSGLATKPVVDLKGGAVYLFSREKPQEIEITTPVATGALRGTEFSCYVGPNGRTSLTVLNGQVELSNALGHVLINSGEQGNVEPGQAPTKTAVIDAVNIIQWCLYYPGIVDADELPLSPGERKELEPSLEAYRAGDLLAALKLYPAGRAPQSAAEKTYRAALLLSVGQVDKAHALLGGSGTQKDRLALEELIAAVKMQPYARAGEPQSAAGWMAESYYRQSHADLPGALKAAQAATLAAPRFGFAWAHLAELEFSFGRTHEGLRDLDEGLRLSPRNAQAVSLRGFLLSAQNRIDEARAAFDEAISIDGALGNAWLGRGLCAIRQGHAAIGRDDLQTAAALEPNRSELRSYLGKAFSNAGMEAKSVAEFLRAEEIDPHDPTPWLYSAIENKQDNRINDAVRDLEKSVALNDNRRIFRSGFLLDQDRAVRSANLAAIYQADGMDDFSVREAVRAVDADYTNPSAHLFLANSYNALRDPRRIILRYETPWFNELLLSNLLSPVGGGPLSQFVSEQEYSKLFESDRFGLSTSTDYYSEGEVHEIASQYGLFGNFSYSIDTEYLFDPGIRPNDQISLSETYAQMKFQLDPDDSLFLQAKFQDTRNGDVLEHYYNRVLVPGADTYLPDFHFTETQTPGLALAGLHHEWSPGVDTLFLAGRLADHLADSQTRNELVLERDPMDNVGAVTSEDLFLNYHSDFQIYSFELQQIFDSDWNTLLLGTRYQTGDFDTENVLDKPPADLAAFFANPPASADVTASFERRTAYIYDLLRPVRWASVTLGVTYDNLSYPENFRDAPIIPGDTKLSRFSPKAGLILTPLPGMTVRGGYMRSVGGASFDESVLLEPTQVAGITQVYRSMIPENVAGEIAGPVYDIDGISVDQKFDTGSYFGLDLLNMSEKAHILPGVFQYDPSTFIPGQPFILPSSTVDNLTYREDDITATFNQLLDRDWSCGLRYKLSRASLNRSFAEIPTAVSPDANHTQTGLLNQITPFVLYNNPSGFFARAEAVWNTQRNDGYAVVEPNGETVTEPGDSFWQFNVYAGYRFRRNLGEISLGLLNIGGEDYHLNPLNLYGNMERERTLLVRVRLTF